MGTTEHVRFGLCARAVNHRLRGGTLRNRFSEISLNQTNISLYLLRIIFKYCATLGKNIACFFDVLKHLKGGEIFSKLASLELGDP